METHQISRRVQMGVQSEGVAEGRGLQQVQLAGPGNRFDPVPDAQFAVRVGDVALDGGRADIEVVRDLLVPHAVRDQTQDLDLPGRQRLGQRGGRVGAGVGTGRCGASKAERSRRA